jgi:biotin synthase
MNTILPKIKQGISNHLEVSFLVKELINELFIKSELKKEDYLFLLNHISVEELDYLYQKAYQAKQPYYQNRVYLRGLIEISSFCKQGCKYCGINTFVKTQTRYRMTKEEILESCEIGYYLGYRTFVIQGGEDAYFTDEVLEDIIKEIKQIYIDVRITLSLGERSYESLKRLYQAGADRYLLRHETASKRLYHYLHHDFMSFENRMKTLQHIKEIGYQVGAGFMVGSPTQTNEDLVEDLLFLKKLNPHMVGIGPYLCHSDTELKGNDSGTLSETLVMVALVRLLLPKALLPATTALGTLDKQGREKALYAGANVMMPNISPTKNRKLYEIYQNKICTGDTSVQCRGCIELKIKNHHHTIDLSCGDHYDREETL